MRCRSYIAGAWHDGNDVFAVELGNPANRREIVSSSVYATPDEAARAMQVAAAAWEDWKQVTLKSRIGAIEKVVTALDVARAEFAQAISIETGKTLREGFQEVDATGLETGTQIDLFREGLTEDVSGYEVSREPLGVVLLVTPSNFPLAAVLRKLVPALLAGNTAVIKASELTPVTANMLFRLIDESGLPAGVANLVLGEGQTVVPPMIEAPALKAVSITGSNLAGAAIARAIGDRDIRLQAEMGGSNVVVVLADADLDRASQAVAEHGFAYCGQWCTGTTRVIVEASVFDRFAGLLLDRVKQISIGPGTDDDVTMGALISSQQRHRVENAVTELCVAGAKILCGGKRPHDEYLKHGYFFEPTILADNNDAAAEFDEEIFGPVVIMISAVDSAAALERANASRYGLSFSVFTRDTVLAERLIAGADAGLCHVNLGTGFRDNALPLLGWKDSGRGAPECGTFARDFFTRTKAIYRAI